MIKIMNMFGLDQFYFVMNAFALPFNLIIFVFLQRYDTGRHINQCGPGASRGEGQVIIISYRLKYVG